MAVYGHYRRRRFETLVETFADGFAYDGSRYTWDDIDEVRVHRWSTAVNTVLFFVTLGLWTTWPTALVYLKDGRHVYLSGGSLVRRGEKPPLNPLDLESDAFEELVSLLRSKWRESLAESDARPEGDAP